MMQRFAACFDDLRCPELIEHKVVTLVASGCLGSRSGMRTSTITTSCATTR
jgi:hypothetical protein